MLAEMIVTGAKVLTMDPAQPRAEAVALAGGKIVAVGSVAEVLALRGPDTRVIEAAGRTLLPGFIESHMHLFGGAELQHLQLTGLHGQDALRAAFTAYAKGRDGMLMAEGAVYSLLPGGITLLFGVAGAVDCTANRQTSVAYWIVVPLKDRSGDGERLDPPQTSAGPCVFSPGTPVSATNDDVVLSESPTQLAGWLRKSLP